MGQETAHPSSSKRKTRGKGRLGFLATHSIHHSLFAVQGNNSDPTEVYSQASWETTWFRVLTQLLLVLENTVESLQERLEVLKMQICFLVIIKHIGSELGRLRSGFALILSFTHRLRILWINRSCPCQNWKVLFFFFLTVWIFFFFLWHSPWAQNNLLIAFLHN